ncbi:expressed unknown protein [Seminavis robusta]|uniref:Uncharacterized protein n=1 Tax=Seminavis robusta TaxID=568900 RepID=A0A9N8H8Q2_9STRA|nr:expressed unknown protein [Seminavis robusta]|eukprot:Sro167_g074320.1 n/a (124) ;mRNA; f:9508-9879
MLEELKAKTPTEEEVTKLLHSFPESIRGRLELDTCTEKAGEGHVSFLDAKTKRKKKKGSRKKGTKSTPPVPGIGRIPAPTQEDTSDRPCSYLEAVAKPIHYQAILDFEATCNKVSVDGAKQCR